MFIVNSSKVSSNQRFGILNFSKVLVKHKIMYAFKLIVFTFFSYKNTFKPQETTENAWEYKEDSLKSSESQEHYLAPSLLLPKLPKSTNALNLLNSLPPGTKKNI